jgi:Mlc titration factor MtfA (ptsG expression regulator)
MKVTIAGQAGLLLLGADHGYYPSVKDVYVFPKEMSSPVAEDDWEDDELSERSLGGMAVDRGPVLLAWDLVLPEGRNPAGGYNVVIHEFAHQLDYADGIAGGAPRLRDRELESRWHYVMTVAFEDHRRAVREKHRDLFFTHHAADNEAEFFADATEAFFCRPNDLKGLYEEIYQLLAAYYRVDPTIWFAGR